MKNPPADQPDGGARRPGAGAPCPTPAAVSNVVRLYTAAERDRDRDFVGLTVAVLRNLANGLFELWDLAPLDEFRPGLAEAVCLFIGALRSIAVDIEKGELTAVALSDLDRLGGYAVAELLALVRVAARLRG